MMRPYPFLATFVLIVFAACQGGGHSKDVTDGADSVAAGRTVDREAMARLEGIWVDSETEAVLFEVRHDSIFYPDTTDMPAAIAVIEDTLVVYGGVEARYPILNLGDYLFEYENLSGEPMHLRRSDNPDDSLFFVHRQYAPILFNELVKRDTVVFTPSGKRYHLYIDVNPTRHRVYHTHYTDEGMAVKNVYYDNIIHISVYDGRDKVFSRDFHKADFKDLVPARFLEEALLSNMEFGRVTDLNCLFTATLCEPEGARCYAVSISVGFDGLFQQELIEY